LTGERGLSAQKLAGYAMVHDLQEYIDIRSRLCVVTHIHTVSKQFATSLTVALFFPRK
jgi:hypothetical protein